MSTATPDEIPKLADTNLPLAETAELLSKIDVTHFSSHIYDIDIDFKFDSMQVYPEMVISAVGFN